MKLIKIFLVISASLLVVIRILSHQLPPYQHALIDYHTSENVDGRIDYYVHLKNSEGKATGMALLSNSMAGRLKPNDQVSLFVKRDLFNVLHDSPAGGQIVVGTPERVFDLMFVFGAGVVVFAFIRSLRGWFNRFPR